MREFTERWALVAVVLFFCTVESRGQRDALEWVYTKHLGKMSKHVPIGTMKVGDGYDSGNATGGKILQILSKDRAVALIDRATVVLATPTDGMVDGSEWGLAEKDWKKWLGSRFLKATSIETLKTTGGAVRTLLVLEPDLEMQKNFEIKYDAYCKEMREHNKTPQQRVQEMYWKQLEQQITAAKKQAAMKKQVDMEDRQLRENKRLEERAAGHLKYARGMLAVNVSATVARLREILKDYPGTQGAKDAAKLLEELGEK
jgi:hypothetical protein